MKKIQLSLLLFCSIVFAKDTYTVDELILKSLENSPEIKISTSEFKASKADIAQAASSYLPTVDLHLSAGEHGQSDISNNPNNMLHDTLILGKLSLKQIIYDFGKTGSNVDNFKYISNASQMNNEQIISNIKKDVKLAYYDVLKSIALINVQEENVKLNEAQLYRSQKYFEAGIRTKIDISDAKVELIKAKLDLKKAEYDLELAYATLDKVIGFKKIHNDYKVYSKALELNNLYESLHGYNLNLSDSITYAYNNRYELKKYAQNVKSSKAQSQLIDSGYYPQVYFNADYTKQDLDKFKNVIPQNKWQASVNLDYNIYQGGATNAQSQESRIQVDIANSKLQKAKLDIKEFATQAYINVHKAKDTVELSQSLVEVSNEKFDQASKRYEYGLSDYIELQQSRQGYIDAKTSLVVNYYSYYQAISSLDNAIGK